MAQPGLFSVIEGVKSFPSLWRSPGMKIGKVDHSAVLAQGKKYTVKLMESRREYVRVQQLRYDVFYREFGGRKFPLGLDRDRYDQFADHLLVIHNESRKVVGCYRAICTRDRSKLYSSSEFDTSTLDLDRPVIELSRACIHRDHRRGATLAILWRGLAAFAQRRGAAVLMGIPSVKTTDPELAGGIHRYFADEGFLSSQSWVRPLPSHEIVTDFAGPAYGADTECGEKHSQESHKSIDLEELKKIIPPLFNSYLRIGAQVLGPPAIDRRFACIDFPVALNLDDLDPAYRRRFLGVE